MLLCDSVGCGGAYHLQCLTPVLATVPEGTWFCRECAGGAAECPDLGAGWSVVTKRRERTQVSGRPATKVDKTYLAPDGSKYRSLKDAQASMDARASRKRKARPDPADDAACAAKEARQPGRLSWTLGERGRASRDDSPRVRQARWPLGRDRRPLSGSVDFSRQQPVEQVEQAALHHGRQWGARL